MNEKQVFENNVKKVAGPNKLQRKICLSFQLQREDIQQFKEKCDDKFSHSSRGWKMIGLFFFLK